ncbi:MAG: LamG-like jellyroll fold domain-containing protein [Anaerolineales bacterium]
MTATDLDRVKIQIDDPANTKAGPPADIGATDFTLEFWMKASAANNTAGVVTCGSNVAWINGNVVIDRDRYSQDRKFGLSLAGGRVVFGISGEGTGDLTVCGMTNVLDGQWHHIAVQRRRSDGWLWLYVDGVLNAQADGPNGDVSYPDGGVPGNYCGGPCTGSDPYLVLGAEKHDAGAAYPSYNGWLDELRLSAALRYSGNFTRPQSPFVTDTATAALYHFDEATSGACAGVVLDSSGAASGPSNGMGRYGGSGVAGPQYSADVPASGSGSATATPPTMTAAPTQTTPASPSGTPSPAADVIFADDFESGAFSAWSSAVTDGGDLSVSGPAALGGWHGLQAVIDDNTAIYLADDHPTAETHYCARFYFDPNSISMVNGNTHTLFRGDAASGATTVRLEFRYSGGVYQVSAQARTDANVWTNTAWVTLSDAAHVLEIDWRAATAGSNNGGVTLWVDNVQRGDRANLDNDTRRVDRVLWGAVSGIDSGTRGAYYFDHFESRRTTYIGP